MFIKDVEVTDIGSSLIVKYPNGRAFKIDKFKGRFAAKMLAKFVKYGSGFFGGILKTMMTQEGNEDELASALEIMMAGSIQGAFSALDDEDFLEFFFSLFTSTSLDGKAVDFDEVFTDDLAESFDLAARITVYNFNSVFQKLGIAALLKTKAQEE